MLDVSPTHENGLIYNIISNSILFIFLNRAYLASSISCRIISVKFILHYYIFEMANGRKYVFLIQRVCQKDDIFLNSSYPWT